MINICWPNTTHFSIIIFYELVNLISISLNY
jgi:hypothetical protein